MAGSRVSHDSDMKMMVEDAYTKFVTETLTEQEGRLTGAQAAAQWFLACVQMLRDVKSSLREFV